MAFMERVKPMPDIARGGISMRHAKKSKKDDKLACSMCQEPGRPGPQDDDDDENDDGSYRGLQRRMTMGKTRNEVRAEARSHQD
jgi:hypothetical protein